MRNAKTRAFIVPISHPEQTREPEMTNRRQFFLRAAAFAAGASALATGSALAETPLLIGLTGAPEHAGRLAWPHPSGLQIYTVREEYARNPLRTLEQVARIGYREVELI